ncbi:hypothetical protein LPU83_pLPU83d_0816 (plasmid) [Rhizobium favelukesii]|uniref:Uncharacterized protein n=1 Tax=Rhizobium favelukesii TaxID=348824 RepID=W6S7L2_9HYPH|nr:hypothetical protein LPU83_pLPU83d_0816 [Rhizobium favelukesii]
MSAFRRLRSSPQWPIWADVVEKLDRLAAYPAALAFWAGELWVICLAPLRKLSVYAALRRRSPCGDLCGLSFASLLRFWAVAASRNSSRAPHGPRSLKRAIRRMRFRCAKSISTFLRRCRDCSYSGVAAIARATSRASSLRSRGTLRAGAFGQQRCLSSQASQSFLLAR